MKMKARVLVVVLAAAMTLCGCGMTALTASKTHIDDNMGTADPADDRIVNLNAGAKSKVEYELPDGTKITVDNKEEASFTKKLGDAVVEAVGDNFKVGIGGTPMGNND